MAIINGTAGDDVLVGTADDDELFGFAGRDDLTGGAGNDLLDGGTGRDTMAGGLGDDVYVVNHDKDAVTESGGEGTDEVQSLRTYTLPRACRAPDSDWRGQHRRHRQYARQHDHRQRGQ